MPDTATALRTTDRGVLRASTASTVSGLLGVAAGIITLVQVTVGSDVPDDQWSAPAGATFFLVFSVGLAITHVLSAIGFTGVARLEPHGWSRAATTTLWVSIAGLYLLGVAEVCSGLIGGQSDDSGAAAAVGTLFGVASLLSAVGGLVAGPILLRRGWTLGGASLLANAVTMLLLVTPANIIGDEYFRMVALTVWSLTFVILGRALRRP
jgi:hypothetical protein